MFDIKSSPIRENINSLKEGQLSVFEDDGLEGEVGENRRKLQVRTILKDIENMFGAMESNQGQAVRIAVMGEVKAGKSTFVNVCVGKEVAYTDILEATAVVSEISYSEEEYVHVLDLEGKVVMDITHKEFLGWTEEQLEKGADFSRYGKIEIGAGSNLLKDIIFVDTPGLLSVTAKNHDVTNRYVAQADYILWVINSRNLGGEAVNDCIDKIRLSGKPMIGIINKVDSPDERREIEEYVKKNYGNIFEEIFYVSSANAWEGITQNRAGWMEQTGFLKVLECIGDLGEEKKHSVDQTQYYQLQREREVHLRMSERIQKRKNYYDNELAQFASINRMIKKAVHTELEDWIQKELYRDERANLMGAKGAQLESLFGQYRDEGYLTDVIEHKYQEMAEFISKKWEVIENRLMVKASQVLIDFQYDKPVYSQEGQEEGSLSQEEAAHTWIKRGAAVGVAFAGYAAWLGPAAATVTFASALPAAVPIAIGVGLVGFLGDKNKISARKIEEDARKKQESIEDLCHAVVKAATACKKELEDALYACTDHYFYERCSLYKEKAGLFSFDFTEPSYGAFCKRLDEYLGSLDREIATLGYGDIPMPPRMEETEGV